MSDPGSFGCDNAGNTTLCENAGEGSLILDYNTGGWLHIGWYDNPALSVHTEVERYEYNAQGHRSAKYLTEGEVIYYSYGPAGELLAESDQAVPC